MAAAPWLPASSQGLVADALAGTGATSAMLPASRRPLSLKSSVSRMPPVALHEPKFKGTNALRGKVNATRIPIEEKEGVHWLEDLRRSTELLGEPALCVHVGDREGDIYELFCAARDTGTHFLIRTCVDRLAGDGDHTIADEMDEVAVKGLHRIQVRDSNGDPDEAVLEIRYRKMRVLPPIGKTKALSRADADGDPCQRTPDAEAQKENRVEVDHRSTGRVSHGCH